MADRATQLRKASLNWRSRNAWTRAAPCGTSKSFRQKKKAVKKRCGIEVLQSNHHPIHTQLAQAGRIRNDSGKPRAQQPSLWSTTTSRQKGQGKPRRANHQRGELYGANSILEALMTRSSLLWAITRRAGARTHAKRTFRQTPGDGATEVRR